ncbi:MAG TPA: AbrB family transcriptional regulator [Candidatus Corynebacterium gallistercoris]|uniref:AbrB family transcriptional regulator n=1 Tax=Candidatus Corynebacterium gallistercoris TaxID=2838530 RepID=A0A9D1URF5_9CORY|nr:AbrB family transcriptional regulator [Candidatus Corynebacterium gallistercoris]
MRKPLATAALSAVAVGLSFIAEKVGIPAAWIFAFLVVFGIYAIVGDRQVTPPKKAMIPAQVIVALLCTAPLTTSSLATIASYAGPTIISLAVTLAVCALASWLLVRFHRTSPTTATLATLAGGASAMVMLSNELKADTRFVTLTQYLRVSIVVLTLPAFVGVLGTLADSGPGEAGVASPQEENLLATNWHGIVGCIVIGVAVWAFTKVTARWFTVSSPYLLLSIAFAMIAVMGLGVPVEYISPDGLVVDAAYALIGIQAGGTLTKSALRQFVRALPVIVGVIALMMATSVAAAFAIAGIWDFPVLDAYLATVPGGIYAVIAFAHEAGTEPIVTVIQVMRVIAMLVVGAYAPQLIKLFWGRRHH